MLARGLFCLNPTQGEFTHTKIPPSPLIFTTVTGGFTLCLLGDQASFASWSGVVSCAWKVSGLKP